MAVTAEVMGASMAEVSARAPRCMAGVSDISADMVLRDMVLLDLGSSDLVLRGRASTRPPMRITTVIIFTAGSSPIAMRRSITMAIPTATAGWSGPITGRVRFAAIVPGTIIGAVTIVTGGPIGKRGEQPGRDARAGDLIPVVGFPGFDLPGRQRF